MNTWKVIDIDYNDRLVNSKNISIDKKMYIIYILVNVIMNINLYHHLV